VATLATCGVVIPTYNRAELLRRTLASLIAQDLPKAAFEVLVDGSSDSTARLVCTATASDSCSTGPRARSTIRTPRARSITSPSRSQ
jgi:GT2 family glycosyltransferase